MVVDFPMASPSWLIGSDPDARRRSSVVDETENHRGRAMRQRHDESVVERLAAFLDEPRTPEDAWGTGESFAEAFQLTDELPARLQHGGEGFPTVVPVPPTIGDAHSVRASAA